MYAFACVADGSSATQLPDVMRFDRRLPGNVVGTGRSGTRRRNFKTR
jgi:hypothetical protein